MLTRGVMGGREKIEAALSQAGTPEIPAVICYEGIYIRDRWDDLTPYPWWYRRAPDVGRQLAWRRKVVNRLGQDWMALPFVAPRAERQHMLIDERPDGVYQVNRASGRVQRLQREAVGGWSEPYAKPAVHEDLFPDSREQIEWEIPLPAPFDPVEVTETGQDDLARALLAEFGAGIFPLVHVEAPLWSTYGYWGFEGMMVSVASRPDLVEYACERLLADRIGRIRAAAALGAAGIWIEDCMTDMVNPGAFARLNVPFLRALADEIRAQKMVSIHYFCGNPAGKWESLLSTGVDTLAFEEGKKGFAIDIAEVVDRVRGRCALLGNLDAIHLLPHADEEALRAEIARQIWAGRRNGSRFVMSVGSPVTPGTSPERVRLYCDLVHDLGSR
jgi:hypothetical protein